MVNVKIGRNDPCPCGSGKKYKKCHMDKKPSEVGVLRAFPSEPGDDFLTRFLFGLGKIRNGAYSRDERLAYDQSFAPVFQNLKEMNLAKRKCREIISSHCEAVEAGADGLYHGNQIDIKVPIDDDLNLFFKDFFTRGQMAVECLMAHAGYMGFNISFMFSDNEKKFLKGAKEFPLDPDDDRFKALHGYITHHQQSWYTSFKGLRNGIEHAGWSLPAVRYRLDDKLGVNMVLPRHENREIVELLDDLWKGMINFIEELVVFLLSLKLKNNLVVMYLPPDKRNKNIPIPYVLTSKLTLGVEVSVG
jgi:hypothetical protein